MGGLKSDKGTLFMSGLYWFIATGMSDKLIYWERKIISLIMRFSICDAVAFPYYNVVRDFLFEL